MRLPRANLLFLVYLLKPKPSRKGCMVVCTKGSNKKTKILLKRSAPWSRPCSNASKIAWLSLEARARGWCESGLGGQG